VIGNRLQNPRTALRFTMGIILLGGGLAGLGMLLRDVIDGSNDQWTFLLDSLGLLVTTVGAFLDFRTNIRFGDLEIPGGRRRAGFQLLGGLVGTLGGCYLLGWVITDESHIVLRCLLTAAMTAGIGCIIAGLLYIGWFGGGDHLERRIQQRANEEW
jgi:hypothetical protein